MTKNKTLFQARKQIYKTYSATKVKKVKLKSRHCDEIDMKNMIATIKPSAFND